MLQKQTYVTVSDHSGAGWIQLFHLYRGSWRRYIAVGGYAKAAVKTIAFYPRAIRGKRYRPLRQGFVVRGMAVQTRAPLRFYDNTRHWSFANSLILLKRRGLFKSKYIYGPLSRTLNKKQYIALFDDYI